MRQLEYGSSANNGQRTHHANEKNLSERRATATAAQPATTHWCRPPFAPLTACNVSESAERYPKYQCHKSLHSVSVCARVRAVWEYQSGNFVFRNAIDAWTKHWPNGLGVRTMRMLAWRTRTTGKQFVRPQQSPIVVAVVVVGVAAAICRWPGRQRKASDLAPPENHCGHPNFRFNAFVYINSKPIDDVWKYKIIVILNKTQQKDITQSTRSQQSEHCASCAVFVRCMQLKYMDVSSAA